MWRFTPKKILLLLSLSLFVFFSASIVFAGNPVTPILPSDNIQDPGSPLTAWGGCTPSDSNCYVTVIGGYTDEQAQDAIGTILSNEFTYNDGAPSISINSINVSKLSGVLPVTNGGTGLGSLGSANQLIRVNGGATALEYFTPAYITGNENITISGDISGSGTTAITTTIGAGKVTNSMLAGSIAYSKLSLSGAILNSDLAGSITSSKLVGSDIATVGTITSGVWNGTAIADAYIASAATWNAKENALTFSTGLTRSVNTITVNTTQNITKLSNLTSNGFVKTSGGDGTLSVDTSTYLTGNQTITLSGDISGSGTTAITTTIGAGKVTNAMLVNSSISINGSPISLGGSVSNLALTTNPLSQFAATTSAQLLGVISDEVGSGALVFGTSPTFTTSIIDPLVIGSIASNGTLTLEGNNTTGNTATNANLIFKVGDNATTTAMTILNNGNVGIGVTTPTYPLAIQKNGAGVQQAFSLQNFQTAAANVGSELDFNGIGDVRVAHIQGAWEDASGNGYLTFSTRKAGTPTEQLRIASTGNVGIGDTSPASLLTVGSGDLFQINSSGAITSAAGITSSGTITFSGFSTNGGLLYTNGSGTLAQTGAGTSTTILHGGTTPSYSAVSLTADVTGTLPVGNGGTGATTLADLITLGTHTTGNYVSSATSNGGLTLTGTEGASLGILLPSATDGLSSTSSSGSGLELLSSGVTLLQGCADNQILKWNEGTDTWGCSNDASGGGAGNSFETISTPAGTNPVADSSTDTLTLTATGTNLTITGNSGADSIDLDISESTLAGAGLAANSSALDVNTGNGIQITSDAVTLGPLSADWNQTGAFNISLNNSSAGLKMLENGGTPTLFGIFDIADLSSSDKTYTFPNATGTVITTGNISDITGLTDSQISDTLTSSIFIGSGSTTNAVDLATAEVAGTLGADHGGTGIANNAASTLTLSGSFGTTFTLSGTTSLTLPTSGTLSTLAGTETFLNKTLTAPKFADLGFLADPNGNEYLIFDSVSSAVNEITIGNAATGSGVFLKATGGDTDVDLSFDAKGAGLINIGNTSTGNIVFGGGSGSTGCTLTNSNGNFACTGTGTFSNISGTNSGDVTLAGENYISIAGQVITANAVNLSGTNVTGTLAAARFGALTGDVTNSAGSYATTISSDAVTYAKMQNVTTNKLLGRATAGSGDTEEITLGTGLSYTGTTLNASLSEVDTLATVTGRGATTSTASSFTGGATIRGATIDTATATDDLFSISITAGGASRFTGTLTNADLTGNKTYTFPDRSGTVSLSGDTFTTDVTGTLNSSGATALTIANDAVTYAKIQNVTTNKLLGRATAGSGDTEEITLGTGLSYTGTTLDVATNITPISSLLAATGTNTINNANFAQEWQWNTLAGTTGLKLSSTSTAAASNAQKLFEISTTGTNSTSAQTTYGAYISNTHDGTTSTNIGAYFTASGGATTNWSAFFNERINVGNANNDANHALIVRSPDNTATHGLKITANNQTASMELGYNSILTGGALVLAPQSTGVEVNSSMYVGAASAPSARLHIAAGTTSASTAPIKLTSGSLMTAPEAGAIEFLTDAFYGTVTTGPTRQQFATDTNTLTFTNKTLTAPKFADLGYLADSNGNEQLILDSVASAVNEITIGNAATGNGVFAKATGGDTDVALSLDAKGAGVVNIGNTSTGDVVLGGGSGSTGCTLTNSSGAFACTAGITGGAGSFTTLTSSGNTTLATGSSTTNTFGSGASSINTIGSTSTPGALTLHGATTLDNTFSITSANTTQTTTSSALVLSGNSLTSGTGLYIESSSLTSGSLIDLSVTGPAAANEKGINVSLSNGSISGGHTTYGIYTSNTQLNAGNTNTNVALYATASTGRFNYAGVFDSGNVGIGDTTPTEGKLTLVDNVNTAPTFYLANNTATTIGAGANTNGVLDIQSTSLTTGNLINVEGNALTSGTALNISSTSANSITGQKGINVALTGALTGAQTTYGGYFSNTRTGASAVNVGLYSTASGATGANYAAIFDQGNVGIGDTTPLSPLTVGSGDLFQVNSSGQISAAAGITSSGTITFSGLSSTGIVHNTSGGVLSTSLVAQGDLLTQGTATDEFCLTSETGGGALLAWQSCGGSSAISGLTVATGTNTIDNANFAQEWQWNTLAGTTGLKLSSTSTAAASNAQKLFEISTTGTNSTSAQTTYGAYISNTHNGTTSTNVGLYATATGGTTANYAIQTVGTIRQDSVNGVAGFLQTNGTNLLSTTLINPGIDVFHDNANMFGFNLGYTGGTSRYSLQNFFSDIGDYVVASFANGALPTAQSDFTPRLTIRGDSGNVGIGTSSPTGRLQIAAGTTSAGTAPIKLTSGSLNTTAEAGAIEFLTDNYYATITTSAARKEFTLNESSLTSSRVPFATTNGRLTDNSAFTYATANGGRLSTTALNLTPSAVNGGSISLATFTGAAHTNQVASTESPDINFNLNRTVQFATGALTTQRAVLVQAPSYGFAGTSTLTDAASLAITGAPKSQTNATITNSHALLIQAGAVQPAGTVTNAYGLTVNTPTGASNNYAAQFAGGNVGIGDASPTALLTVGSGDLFQVNSSGQIAAVAGYTQGSGTFSHTSTTATGDINAITDNSLARSTSGTVNLELLTFTNNSAMSSGTSHVNGLNVVSTVNIGGAAGINNTNAIKVSAPTLTTCAGPSNCVWNGLNIATTAPSSDITVNGINIAGATAPSSSTINGLNIGTITGGSGTETAISIGTGWDTAISTAGNYTQSAGTMSLTSANTTQTTTGSIFALNGNSLTSGTGFYGASSTLSSGSLVDLAITGTAAASNTQKVLNISTSGANATSTQTTYGGYFSNTHTGTSSTNVGLYTTASGGTNNYAGVFDAGRVLIGLTSETVSASKLYVQATNSDASGGATAAVAGIHEDLTFSPSGGGTQVGNRLVLNEAPTSVANTMVGQIVRTVDNTTLANTVRGIEVLSSAGSNTTGTNTGIRSTGATFGVQGITTGLAGGVLAPAALYGQNDGTTQGDALRLYSTTMTSAAQMAYFYHDTSTFTGTGLLMDFATGSGTFSGNFVDFQNNNVSKFTVTNAGVVSMGLSGTASTNAVCSSLANATGPTAGTAYEIRDCNAAPAADYAEMYPVEVGIEYGDIVATGTAMVDTYDTTDGNVDWTKVKGKVSRLVKSSESYQENVVGIVSDNHGDFTSAGHNIKEHDNPMPIALNGRVPVKIASTSDAIAPGDYLATSNEFGKATKATDSGQVIGKALEAWTPGSGLSTIMVFVEQGYHNDKTIKIEDLSIKIKNIEDLIDDDSGSFVGHLRNWLASVTNGITTIFANTFQGNTVKARDEVCVGDTCINEDQLKALILQNQNGGGSNNQNSGGGGNTGGGGGDPQPPADPNGGNNPPPQDPPNPPADPNSNGNTGDNTEQNTPTPPPQPDNSTPDPQTP